jgi:hypothetical protein
MIPTATASDHIERESSSSETLNPLTGKSVSLDRFVKFWPTEEVQQSGEPEMWPTPHGFSKDGGLSNGPSGNELGRAVNQSLWPTPKSSPSGPDFARMGRPESGGDDLATAVARFLPTPTATDHKGSGQNDTMRDRLDYVAEKPEGKRVSGSLNPQWVEWLMGYPEGWTDLED